MDKKVYIILKTLNDEDRVPTTEEIEISEFKYKTLLGKLRDEGLISNLCWESFDVNRSHAELELPGIEYINNYEKKHKNIL